MSLSRYLTLMVIMTALCWAAWYQVISSINPSDTGPVGFILFYATITLALTGSCAVIGFLLRTLFVKSETPLQKVIVSFRQGIFFALLIDGFLYLQSMRLLTWYNVAFLIVALTIAEFFMISRRSARYE